MRCRRREDSSGGLSGKWSTSAGCADKSIERQHRAERGGGQRDSTWVGLGDGGGGCSSDEFV